MHHRLWINTKYNLEKNRRKTEKDLSSIMKLKKERLQKPNWDRYRRLLEQEKN